MYNSAIYSPGFVPQECFIIEFGTPTSVAHDLSTCCISARPQRSLLAARCPEESGAVFYAQNCIVPSFGQLEMAGNGLCTHP